MGGQWWFGGAMEWCSCEEVVDEGIAGMYTALHESVD